MPLTSQALYFHLGMSADDDGFVSPRKILRMTGAGDDDLKILLTKNFVIRFETGVIVITHWKQNNYLRNDRYLRSTRPLATSRAHRTSASERAGQVACLELGGRAAGSPPRAARSVPQALRRPCRPAGAGWRRAPELDQLLGDRPGERLERVGAGSAAATAGARIRAEQAVRLKRWWNGEVVVEVEGEAHPLERVARPSRRRARRAKPHGAARGPGATTTAHSSPWWIARTSARPRRRSTPSRPAPGIR